MKERESETESWCWSLSKKTLFLSLTLFFLAVLMCSDKPTVRRWWNRHNTTDEESQLVVRGSHMLLVFLSPPQLHSRSLSSLNLLSYCLPPLPPVLAVAVNISQTFDCQAWCIVCASEPFAHSHSCPYLGCEESPVSSVLNCYLIIL